MWGLTTDGQPQWLVDRPNLRACLEGPGPQSLGVLRSRKKVTIDKNESVIKSVSFGSGWQATKHGGLWKIWTSTVLQLFAHSICLGCSIYQYQFKTSLSNCNWYWYHQNQDTLYFQSIVHLSFLDHCVGCKASSTCERELDQIFATTQKIWNSNWNSKLSLPGKY